MWNPFKLLKEWRNRRKHEIFSLKAKIYHLEKWNRNLLSSLERYQKEELKAVEKHIAGIKQKREKK